MNRREAAPFLTPLRQALLDHADIASLPLTVAQVTELAYAAMLALRAPELPTAELCAPLSPVERDVLFGLAIGETSEETAARLCRNVETVRSHRRHIYRRLGARSGAQAVALGVSLGLLAVPCESEVAA
ncbi:helix-turn-helix transcriptional regulator [Streptomyces sp. NPDC001941]|uniref:helix-turn-helix transcriptional regulator n=1 Tax=Streptomyces sp. NPDC001941 TaxID=3154659 RepID=UPI00331CDDB9